MSDEFDPVKAGQETARENAKVDKEAGVAQPESIDSVADEARKTAKKNALVDESQRGEATMEPQDVGTSDRDIPEGKPVTDNVGELPEVSTELSLKELQGIAKEEGVEGNFTKPGTSKQSVVDAILAKRGQ